MKSIFTSVHSHIKNHHKKYLFGIFGGFAVVKLFLLVLGLSVVQYTNTSIFAEGETGCVLTGQEYTGEYQTGGYLTGQELTGGYLTGCTTISGYRTGGALDESGTLTGETRVEETQTGCELTGQTLTEGYMTGYYLTGGYWTGGYLTGCISETGENQTGNNQTGNNQTGNNQTGNVMSGNGICESGDVVWNAPVSGSIVRDIFNISWSYSGTDCIVSGLSLQLRDHNNQRITLSTLASGTTSYTFDSRRLYSFQQSGFYSIIGNTGGGNLTLYSGNYSGNYSRFFTGYILRLLDANQTPIYETLPFTIDNQTPALSGIALTSSGSATGYLNVSGVVTLSFVASEELAASLQVTLGSGKAATSSIVSGLNYTYMRNLTSLYSEGALTANIVFADKAGNTGAAVYTSTLFFDKTKPVITGFVFSEYTEGLHLNFSGSEPVRYASNYRKTGGIILTSASADYLTAQQLNFSGLERDQLYAFRVDVFDRAGNTRAVTGDFLRTNLGQIVSHAYIIPLANETTLSGSLATLAVVLKAEVEKFNACKNALSYIPVELEVRHNSFILQMPTFKKSQVKTLVNAFTLFVLDEVKRDYKISKADIDDITKKFDNFLIILKLIRDDDGICQQHLSNYHITQFKNALEEYKISLE